MKRIAFRIPKHQERAVIIVDDADAARFRVEYWNARSNKGNIEIYKYCNGVMTMLGRELLGITADNICVIHRNDDELDYRRANLMAITRSAHTRLFNLMSPRVGNKPGTRLEFCKRGHPLTPENRKSNGKNQSTICILCAKIRRKRYYEKTKV